MAFWDKFKKQHGAASASKKKEAVSPKAVKKEEKSVASIPAVKAGEKKEDTRLAYRILLAPLQSEKAARLSGQNQYVFEVAAGANKLEVKEAVFRVYGVRPVAVNIVRLPRKRVRYGRTEGIAKMRVKAIVTLPPGKTISIYEGV